MPKLTELQELETAIRLTATDAEPNARSMDVAREFYDANRELVASVADQWIVEKLTVLISTHRAKFRRDSNPQLVLEGMLGVKRLPIRLKLKSGKSIARSDATVGAFVHLVAVLRKRKSPALEDAERALALMREYNSGWGGKRLTWGELIQLEAEAAAKKAAKKK
jgi:hypothetical protein